MFSNEDKDEPLVISIILRTIGSSISILFCLLIISLYFIHLYHIRKDTDTNTTINQEVFVDDISSGCLVSRQSKANNVEQREAGLPSHFMFFLMTSFLVCSINDIILFGANCKDMKLEKLNHFCQGFGFFAYFFEFLSVGWSTCLFRLFYLAIRGVDEEINKKKAIILNWAFCFFSSLIITLITFLNKVFNHENKFYKFAKTRCINEESFYGRIASYTGASFEIINTFFSFYCLYKIIKYYTDKYYNLDITGEKQKAIVKNFIFVFIIFPIYIFFSRGMSCLNRLWYFIGIQNELFIKIFECLTNVIMSLGGTVNGLACLFFFKEVLFEFLFGNGNAE